MRIVILATEGEKATILYNTLCKKYEVCKVFIEESVPKKQLITRRIKKLGIRRVFGQLLFKAMVVRRLEKKSEERITEIKQQYGMDTTGIPEVITEFVKNINEEGCISLLKKINPDLIIVNGTRIISKQVLNAVKVPFLNMHAGITPLYRGVHGGYWALAEQDREHCGVTVHLIDEGIDTGGVIYQSVITVTEKDNFVTYPYLQFALGLKDMVQAIEDYNGNGIKTIKVDLPSRFRTHPTLREYRTYKKKFGVE